MMQVRWNIAVLCLALLSLQGRAGVVHPVLRAQMIAAGETGTLSVVARLAERVDCRALHASLTARGATLA
ncbi:MAG: hypothetical protein WB626_10390, partial [Bacteroidota bacterium]